MQRLDCCIWGGAPPEGPGVRGCASSSRSGSRSPLANERGFPGACRMRYSGSPTRRSQEGGGARRNIRRISLIKYQCAPRAPISPLPRPTPGFCPGIWVGLTRHTLRVAGGEGDRLRVSWRQETAHRKGALSECDANGCVSRPGPSLRWISPVCLGRSCRRVPLA